MLFRLVKSVLGNLAASIFEEEKEKWTSTISLNILSSTSFIINLLLFLLLVSSLNMENIYGLTYHSGI